MTSTLLFFKLELLSMLWTIFTWTFCHFLCSSFRNICLIDWTWSGKFPQCFLLVWSTEHHSCFETQKVPSERTSLNKFKLLQKWTFNHGEQMKTAVQIKPYWFFCYRQQSFVFVHINVSASLTSKQLKHIWIR